MNSNSRNPFPADDDNTSAIPVITGDQTVDWVLNRAGQEALVSDVPCPDIARLIKNACAASNLSEAPDRGISDQEVRDQEVCDERQDVAPQRVAADHERIYRMVALSYISPGLHRVASSVEKRWSTAQSVTPVLVGGLLGAGALLTGSIAVSLGSLVAQITATVSVAVAGVLSVVITTAKRRAEREFAEIVKKLKESRQIARRTGSETPIFDLMNRRFPVTEPEEERSSSVPRFMLPPAQIGDWQGARAG